MEDLKDIIEIVINSQTTAAALGFMGAILAQFLLRKQIANLELKKFSLDYRRQKLDKLKEIGEDLIREIYAYDEMANHIILTVSHRIHAEDRMDQVQAKLKAIKEDVAPKFQIHFHELTTESNAYSAAVASFHDSFFSGLKWEGFKQKGYSEEDIDRMNEEYKSIQHKKYDLVVALINLLTEKENEIVS
jgi:hypothetical protein